MEQLSSLENTAIEPETIIGTEWNGWGEMFCERLKIEFVDTENCIYISKPNKYPMTYTVFNDKIFISDIKDPFEVRGNMLFHGGLPVFKKAA